MASKRKSWTEKMLSGSSYKIERTQKRFADIPEGSRMLIATPSIIDDYIRSIPEGKEVDLRGIRKYLAIEYGVDYTCPVTTGIFLRIVAEKAFEDLNKGKSIGEITPFWRVINMKSPTAKKLTFGLDLLRQQREKEGLGV